MKRAAEPILVRLRQAFAACKDFGRGTRLRQALLDLSRIYDVAVAPDGKARDDHRAALIRLYKLEQRGSLVDQFMIADRSLAASLGASYNEARSDRWCMNDFDSGPR